MLPISQETCDSATFLWIYLRGQLLFRLRLYQWTGSWRHFVPLSLSVGEMEATAGLTCEGGRACD
jgi:hypothetical protein